MDASMKQPSKKSNFALAVLVPDCPRLEEWRSEHDKGFPRWPSHVSLFLDAPPAVLKLDEWPLKPFRVTLTQVYRTRNSKYVMIRCEDEQPEAEAAKAPGKKKKQAPPPLPQMAKLRQGLAQKLGVNTAEAYCAHVTVGQLSQEVIDGAIMEMQAQWEPISFEVAELAVIQKTGDRYQVIKTIQLK